MDIFAHGLWTNLAFNKRARRDRWWAVFFGVAPDIFSLGPFVAWMLFTRSFQFHTAAPAYAAALYNVTHSLVIFALVFGGLTLGRHFQKIKPAVWLPLCGWAIHVLIDIPTHTTDFFPTPFLWPLSSFKVSGINWADSTFMLVNYSLLILFYFQLKFWPKFKGSKKIL